MTGWRLYHDLRQRGIHLRLRGGRIQASGPLTDADRTAIRALAHELAALLGERPPAASPAHLEEVR